MSDLSPLYAPHGVSDPATAHQQAIVALGSLVKQQALAMGFSDAFAVVGVVLVIAGIAILLTGKPKGGAAAGGDTEAVGCRQVARWDKADMIDLVGYVRT